jgi:hypothetical protein
MTAPRRTIVVTRVDRRDPRKDVVVRIVEDETGPATSWLVLLRPSACSAAFAWTAEAACASAFGPETAALVAANLDAAPDATGGNRD